MPGSEETIRDEAVAALDKARRRLNSASALLKLRAAPEADRRSAGAAIVEAGVGAQALRRARLEDIAKQLEAEADSIRKATADLNDALDDVKAIKPVVDGATALLGAVARVVALV